LGVDLHEILCGILKRLQAARSEWDAEFRVDISALFDEELIESAIDYARPLELEPRPTTYYKGFVDASAGRHDAYVIAIAHKERSFGKGTGKFVIDVVRGVHPPFDPQTVTQELAALARQYRLSSVVGDNFAAEWVAGAWTKCNIRYTRCEHVKSQLYLESLPLWARGLVSIPDHKRLTRELRLLERRTHRSGKDSVDHGRTGSDDYANAVAGVLVSLAAYFGYDIDLLGRAYSWDDPDPQLSQVQLEAQRHYDELLQRYGQPVSLMAPEFREK
jgi:hypothetical protein